MKVMRNFDKFTVSFSVALVLLAGCSGKPVFSTAQLEQNFIAADPGCQNCVYRAVAAIQAGDFAIAGLELRTLTQDPKLTPEQHQAIRGVLAQVDRALKNAPPVVPSAASLASKDEDSPRR